jgi:hypothetical protein
MFQGYGDFASFYTAGRLLRNGEGGKIYDAQAQWREQQEFARDVKIRKGPLPYIRPAFEALLFAVFAGWPFATALVVWTIFKLSLLVTIPFLVIEDEEWRGPPVWMVGVLLLGTFPAFIDQLMGQDAPVLAFLLALSFRWLAQKREAWAGIPLGLALFKFQLILPLVIILVIGGRKKVMYGFAGAAAAAIAASAAVVGWGKLVAYPRYLLELNQTSGAGVIFPQYQINLRGLLAFVAGASPYPGRIHWLLAPIALAAIAYAGIVLRRADAAKLAEGFGLALIVAMVTGYYTHDYDLLLLAVPLLAMREARGRWGLANFLERAGLLLLLLTPLYWLARIHKAESLMVLPLLLVGVAWLQRLSADRKNPRANQEAAVTV